MLDAHSPCVHFASGHTDEAQELVRVFHYSHRWPSNVQVVGTLHRDGGLFGDLGEAVAACVFSVPPTRWSVPVLELSRLVRRDDVVVPLSSLIAKTARLCNADLLVSFADRTHGHHGGIYQACSWNYAGCRDRRMDGLMIDGAYLSGRTANHVYGTQSPTKLKERGVAVEPHYDEGKHLYWRAMTREGKRMAAQVGLGSLPYPKPGLA